MIRQGNRLWKFVLNAELKADKNIGLIIIDYLQLMSASSRIESREREDFYEYNKIKGLA